MNVLFLTHRLPYAPNRGDRVRAYHTLSHLRQYADVHVVSLVHDAAEALRKADVEKLAASVRIARVTRLRTLIRSAAALPTRQPLTHTLLDSAELWPAVHDSIRSHKPDVVLAYCSGMGRLAFAPPLANVPCVLDMVDVDSAKWRDLSAVSRPPLSWIYRREALTLGAFEAAAANRSVATMVVTERERETLRSMSPHARIEVVGNGVDIRSLRPPGPPSSTPDVVFCGVMNYPPNEHAATLLARDVMPRVRLRRPDARLTLVGSSPSPAVQALESRVNGVQVTGAVDDVRPYLWRAAVAAAPLVTARGIQNKVLEAVAAGLPTVVTPNVASALPAEVMAAVVSASGADAIADAILRLLDLTAEQRREMADRANLASLTWEHQLAPIEGLMRRAMQRDAIVARTSRA